ncbi:MAG TPA: BMC domain-containing protein [Patescibacteria group bacterium]|nr:BMC domain-containing protein [Patescibacteria group bacterium]
MLNSRIIRAPRPAVIAMLMRRMPGELRRQVEEANFDAVGLIQTSLPNLFYYTDMAQKAGNVIVAEIHGNCPQHVSTVAFFGSNEAVNAAMTAIMAAES